MKGLLLNDRALGFAYRGGVPTFPFQRPSPEKVESDSQSKVEPSDLGGLHLT